MRKFHPITAPNFYTKAVVLNYISAQFNINFTYKINNNSIFKTHSSKIQMKLKFFMCAALFLPSYVNIAAASPTFQYKLMKRVLSKPTNSITALNESKRTTFVVTDSFGIGGATITLASGEWPKQIALRFRYEKGRGFRRLEGFNLTTAGLQVRGGMQDSSKMSFYFLNVAGKYDAGDSPAGEMNILVEERNNAVEVTLPSNLFAGSKQVKIEWIDAYR